MSEQSDKDDDFDASERHLLIRKNNSPGNNHNNPSHSLSQSNNSIATPSPSLSPSLTAVPSTSDWVTLRDGYAVYEEKWLPLGAPDASRAAAVAFVHGLGDHVGRYAAFFRALSERGITVLAWDQRGWGRSAVDSDTGVGKRWLARGHSGPRDVVMADIGEAISRAAAISSTSRVFLMGQSMGGLLVLDYLTAAAVSNSLLPVPAGVISFAPALGVPRETAPGFLKYHAARVASLVAPRMTLATNLRFDALSHDPAVGAYARSDALRVPVVSLATARYILERGPQLVANGAGGGDARQTPTLLLHGSDDVITDCDATKAYASARGGVSGADVTLRVYPGYLHELMHEPDIKDEVVACVAAWIGSRPLAPSGSPSASSSAQGQVSPSAPPPAPGGT